MATMTTTNIQSRNRIRDTQPIQLLAGGWERWKPQRSRLNTRKESFIFIVDGKKASKSKEPGTNFAFVFQNENKNKYFKINTRAGI